MSAGAEPLTFDACLEALSNERRRYIVRLLSTEPVENLRELATAVAALETGDPRAEVGGDAYQRVYIALQQHHLDTLVRHGIVDWDGRSGQPVEPGDGLRRAVTVLDAAAGAFDGADGRALRADGGGADD